jgi:hypothetical protein
MIITLVFKKNANFFAENWEKSQKTVIITSTPGCVHFLKPPTYTPGLPDGIFSNPKSNFG